MPQRAGAEVVDRIVAIVNDSIITLSELNAAIALASEEFRVRGRALPSSVELKSDILDDLIEQKLVKQAGERAGIEVSEIEIDKAVNEVKRDNDLNHDSLLLALANTGLTYKEYRAQLKEQLRQVKFLSAKFRSGIKMSEEDLKQYYVQHTDEFLSRPGVRLRIIFFSNLTPELQEKRLEAALQKLKDGKSFASIASKLSEGPGVEDGGDIGFVSAGELDPSIENMARRLELGEISKPIYTSSGVSIIQLIARRGAEPLPFEDVRREIQERLYNKIIDEKFEHWLKDVRGVAHIEVRL